MKKKLFLVDGTALLYRAHFAFIRNPLINKDGFNISAIYGVVNSFLKVIDTYKPDNILITFDRKEKTFRHEMDANYKANRPPMPDDLILQIEPVKRFFEIIGIPDRSLAGYEADDVIGTLTDKYKSDYEVYIVSGDKDFAQLVFDDVYLLNPFKDECLGQLEIEEKYEIRTSQFIDYLAIVGDTADNIPGVKGIGPKGAVKLLKQFEDLTEIYNNLDTQKGATLKKLTESKENAFLSFELAKINTQVPIEIPNPEELILKIDNVAQLDDYFAKYDMPKLGSKTKNILKEFLVNESEEDSAPLLVQEKGDDVQLELFATDESEETASEFNAILINSTSELSEVWSANTSNIIAIDTETTSLSTQEAELVGISFCYNEKEAYYIPLKHFAHDNLDTDQVLALLGKHLAGKLVIGHNIKYDLEVLEYHGLKIDNQLFDTMIASFLIDPTAGGVKLDKCMEREFDYQMKAIVDLIGKGKKQKTFDSVEVNEACFYAAEDAWATFKLSKLYKDKLEQAGLSELYNEIEEPLIYATKYMEMNGAYIDEKFLMKLSESNNTRLNELVKEIYDIAGYEFNINSTKQLGKLLFEEMEIPPVKKTKTGYSTDASVLEALAQEHDIAKLIVEYRQITKLESTYITALPKMISEKTGRVHSSFNQVGASTGRLSSNNPNLQNIPIRTPLGKEIRKAFTAQDKGNIIVAADYSQIELRLLAIFSEDETLVNTFNNGGDIHRETAGLMFNKPVEEITSDERRSAKTINFGIIYGMGPQKLSKELSISLKEAKAFIEHYFEKFPTIKDYMNRMVLKAKEHGYCETISNRRLFLSGINSTNRRLYSEAERVAVNMPIQGSAADVIKIAMNRLHDQFKDRDDVKMIIQVHDELVFEVKKESQDEIVKIIKTEMEGALAEEYSKIVKMSVDIGIGKNWLESH
jgi:DNA polymerase-1